jgi:hypothetical protein
VISVKTPEGFTAAGNSTSYVVIVQSEPSSSK